MSKPSTVASSTQCSHLSGRFSAETLRDLEQALDKGKKPVAAESLRPGLDYTMTLCDQKGGRDVSHLRMVVADAALNWDTTEAAVLEMRFDEFKARAAAGTEAIYLGDGRIRLGRVMYVVDEGQSHVVQALVELGAATKDQLIEASGRKDAIDVLKAVRKSIPQLSPHIILPGGKGKGGYRTTIRPA